MKLGTAGLELIKSFEKCRLEAYLDEALVWTIGWGHTGKEVVSGLTCTQAQADAWLEGDAQSAVAAVNRSLDVALNQNQFDALVAFTFNVGITAESHSTLIKLVNQGRTVPAADEFSKWIHSGGHVSNGLVARRAAERALFLTPQNG